VASVLIIDGELAAARDIANNLIRDLPRAGAGPTRVDVLAEADFSRARARMKAMRPALMVTAVQLKQYNGMHLVYMASAAALPTRCVVHTDAVDPIQAREVRENGAFYEIRSRLRVVLPAYVMAVLPPEDRRDPIKFDRRRLARGGRRSADFHPSL
jgi:hypothetical protein